MKNWGLWLWFLTKRLLKKKSFVALLLMLPLLVIGCSAIDWEDSGMVTVVLASEAPEDPLAAQVMAELQTAGGWIRYLEAENEAAATELVRRGEADAAWIFRAELAERIVEFVEDRKTPVVRILQREESVLLRLTAETLSGALYSLWSEPLYSAYVTERIPELANLSREALLDYQNRFVGNESLFAFSVIGGVEAPEASFLITPLRGLLGIWILLCAMAAAMYFIQDRTRGVFAACTMKRMPAMECASLLAALPWVSLAALVALGIAGLWSNIGREILVAALYLPCCGCFAALLGRICRKVQTMAAMLPVLTVAMLLVCPVFFDLKILQPLQYLLPPTYYIQGAYSDRFLLLMPVYALVCLAGCCCFRNKQ